ncbi:hypothetical protein A2U01_0000313 [Trifolium medium]|uniref:Uncharacterized protein n=1 Tax=Trifolium medium TaxID=97028 RepID=A0A392LX80_9FABA|nr:hypothetical protein [Trifolium medium]
MSSGSYNQTDDGGDSFHTAVYRCVNSTPLYPQHTDPGSSPQSPSSPQSSVFGSELGSEIGSESHKTQNNSGLMLSEVEQQILEPEGLGIDLKSLTKAVDELHNQPRNGEIYESIYVHRDKIVKRLTFLSNKPGKLSIDEATEIYDASVLLKLPTRYIDGDAIDGDNFEAFKMYQESVHLAGQIAHSGVLLMHQGKMLKKKGRQLFDQSKSKLQEAKPF